MGIIGVIIIIVIVLTVIGAIIFAPFYLIYTNRRDKSIISTVVRNMDEIKAVFGNLEKESESSQNFIKVYNQIDSNIQNIEDSYSKLKKAYSSQGFEKMLNTYETDYNNVFRDLSDFTKNKAKEFFSEFSNSGKYFKLSLASKIYFLLINSEDRSTFFKSIIDSTLVIDENYFFEYKEMNNFILSKILEPYKLKLKNKCETMLSIRSFDLFKDEFQHLKFQIIEPLYNSFYDRDFSLKSDNFIEFISKYLPYINERIEYFFYKNQFELENNSIEEFNNLVETFFNMFQPQLLFIDDTKFDNFQEFVEYSNKNKHLFLEFKKFIESDNSSLVDNFTVKYPHIDISDHRFTNFHELLNSKGFSVSNLILFHYTNYIADGNEIDKIISTLNNNCTQDISKCIEFYLSMYFEENNINAKAALIEYVNSSFNNKYSLEDLDQMIESAKKSIILKNFEDSLNNDEFDPIDIDSLSGYDFENYLSKLFTRMGYSVEETKLSGDQGADLVIEKMGIKTVVQAKRYSSNVGNSAIQEIVASKNLYNADKAMVVTNSNFTSSAIELAKSNSVELIDGERLNKMITSSMS